MKVTNESKPNLERKLTNATSERINAAFNVSPNPKTTDTIELLSDCASKLAHKASSIVSGLNFPKT